MNEVALFMKRFSGTLKVVVLIALLIGTAAFAADPEWALINGKKTVAMVNGEPITREEFRQELALIHAGIGEGKKAGKINEAEYLRRLINARLLVQEAKRIGLDELPETKKLVDLFSRATLEEQLMERHVRNIQVDEKEVERLYRESIKEWKIRSVLFEKEDAAKKMEEETRAGKNFDEVAERFVANGAAKRNERGSYLPGKDLLPEIVEAVSKMEVGSISPVIPVKTGFVIIKLEDLRYPENEEAREQVRRKALNHKRAMALREYEKALIKKYVKVHREVLDRLDYESKEPGFQELLKDKRVIAEVKGEQPVTVGELSEYLKQQFYHGVQKAIERRKLNERKVPALEEMLHKRVFRKEALRLGIDKTEVYQNKVKVYENSVIFEAFIQKAVAPDIKLKEEELKTYYHDHLGEYTSPEMMKINSLVFAQRADAEGAIEKMRKGTDFQWLMANAEGQVGRPTPGLLIFDGKVLTVKDLPEGVRKATSGAKSGDLRLYASPEGFFFVLFVERVFPAKPQPFGEAREDIAKKVFNDRLKKKVEDWVERLRAVSDIRIYLKETT